ncbi:hypothetical protein ACFOON_10820 [Novosphingobium piscinae]|uniref:Uncharacterized protein n=1 Tax=Novosphingobium piscinae TaxID=1507448 RepID=A0A7X1G1Y7_9SPHN|nr:hypothetical protein [Novosphingobium piscinae]MBC2670517.1 hypothetical protein [Novosphingobium piscinae]
MASSSSAAAPGARRNWRALFLAALAETSNVSAAAQAAGISLSCVYRTKRDDPDFAADWLAALCEGYDRLELELLGRLRGGEPRQPADGAERRHDNATGLRLLLAHRDSRTRYMAQQDAVSAEAIRASIEDKLARLREWVLTREAAEAGGGQETDGDG